MPDLEISPTVHSMVSPAPSYSSSAPEQEEIARASGRTQQELQHASTLLSAAFRQDENHETAASVVDYTKQRDNLDIQVAGIQDLPTRLKLYDTGLNSILDNLRKQHPNLTDAGFKSIQLGMLADRKQHYLKVTTDKISQGRRDIKALGDEYPRLIASAKSESERNRLQSIYSNYLDTSVNNGILHQNEADDARVKLLHDVAVAKVDNLINTDPKKVALLTPNDKEASGLTATELYTATTKALHKINQINSAGLQQRKEQKDQFITRFENGQTTSDEDINGVRNQTITRGDFHRKYGIEPPPEQNDAAVQALEGELDRFVDPNEQLQFYTNHIQTANLNPVDRERLRTYFSSKQQDLKSQFKVAGINSYQALLDHVNSRIGQINPALRKYLPSYGRLNPTLSGIDQRIKAAKTETEMQEYIQKGYEDIDAIIDQMLHKGTKAAAPNVMKETEKPGEAAPAVGPPGVIPENKP